MPHPRLYLTHTIAACLILTAALTATGETTTHTATGETGITYHVLAPANDNPAAAPPPIVIAFSPNGDGLGILNKLKDGVSPAGWILIGCDALKNGLKDRDREQLMEDEVLDDILRTVPHDPARIYLAGFSGGAMRAYDLTTRRPEPFAGIIAYGGWLGGAENHANAFREGLTVAMINGTQDRGAGAWVATDTTRLRELNATVKHYYFVGGHTVAPPEVTAQAVTWLDQQWHATSTEKSPLEILYVGNDPERTNAFRTFLSGHFTIVNSTTPDTLTLTAVNRADVLILDAPVVSLPDSLPKAMVIIGPATELTAQRYGSKFKLLSREPIQAGGIGVPANSLFESSALPTQLTHAPAYLIKSPTTIDKTDTEPIAMGIPYSSRPGAIITREAHRLFWGFEINPASIPTNLSEAFIDALRHIHDFDGHQQTVYRGLRTRAELLALFNDPNLDPTTLSRWLSASLLEASGPTLPEIRAHLIKNAPYLQIPHGSGLFKIDAQAQALGTPNDEIVSIQKWITLLDDEAHQKTALNLLLTYTGQRIRRQPAKWQTWLDENRDTLEFRDDLGYQFHPRE